MTAPAATGLLKQVRIAAESTYGAAASAGGTSQQIRRVSSAISLTKSGFKSNEIQPDGQVHDFRHGVRSVSGQLRGELSPLTYEALFAQLLRGTFVAGASSAGLSITASAAVLNTSPAKFVRASGSFITDGFKIGDIIQCTGFTSGPAANNARNYRITGMPTTATAGDTLAVGPTPSNANITVDQANATEVVVAGSGTVTIAVVGKKLTTPLAGSAVDSSFSIEHWFSDVAISELFTGCKASKASIQLPPNGLATCDFDVVGQNMTLGTAAYFTAPSTVTTSALTTAVTGLMRVNGHDYAIVTGLSLSINAGFSPETVVGSAVTPYLFPGIQDITGQFTALLVDNGLTTAFLLESEIQLLVTLNLTNAVNSDFITFNFPRIKLSSATKDDKPGAIVGSYSFQAMNQVNGGAGTIYDASTLVIQDSLAV
jgi:hypothetical protein